MTKENIKETLLENRDRLRSYHVRKIGVFGSYARGSARKKSDIDLLVEFDQTVDLFDFYHLTDEISSMLDTKIDLATVNSLKPLVKSRVMEEVEWIEGL